MRSSACEAGGRGVKLGVSRDEERFLGEIFGHFGEFPTRAGSGPATYPSAAAKGVQALALGAVGFDAGAGVM